MGSMLPYIAAPWILWVRAQQLSWLSPMNFAQIIPHLALAFSSLPATGSHGNPLPGMKKGIRMLEFLVGGFNMF